jgi:DNA-binding transcriptional LysR family regulator
MFSLQSSLPGLIGAVHTADAGSFTAAAKVLGLSPAAVSKNVATLEAQLGVRIFNRTTRRLSLTEEGTALVREARGGLAVIASAFDSASAGQQAKGLVRVNCPVGFGRRYVVPKLAKFYAAFPLIQLELNLDDRATDLVGGGFDIGIRGGSQPPEGMVARKICNLTAVLVATPKYLKQRGTPRTPADLMQHDLLRIKFLSGKVRPWVFKDRQRSTVTNTDIEIRTCLWLSDPDIMLDAILQNLGIGAIGYYHAQDALARGTLVQVLHSTFVGGNAEMSMFYPHRTGLAPRVRAFIDFMLAEFRSEPSLQ